MGKVEVYRSPLERRDRRRRRWRLLAVLAVGFVVLTLLDVPLAHMLYIADRHSIESADVYRLVRVVGSFWTWVLVAVVLQLHDRVNTRSGSALLAPLCAGLTAELLKIIVVRERPVDEGILRDGWYVFRTPFSGFVNGYNLGFPSSHTAVAFAGCLVLAAWMPRARWVFVLLAAGCGLSRMLPGSHFATDVYVGALIGWWWARVYEPLPARRTIG